MLVGWMFMLVGVIFFFVGGGGAILIAIIAGRFSSAMLEPRHLFSGVGFGIWLLGAILMLAGWIGCRRKQAQAAKRSRK